jgi:hypothetical protein
MVPIFIIGTEGSKRIIFSPVKDEKEKVGPHSYGHYVKKRVQFFVSSMPFPTLPKATYATPNSPKTARRKSRSTIATAIRPPKIGSGVVTETLKHT